MTALMDQRSTASRIVTAVILVGAGFGTAMSAFALLGEPAFPLWSRVPAFAALAIITLLASWRASRIPAPWVYAVDLAVAVSIGLTVLVAEESTADPGPWSTGLTAFIVSILLTTYMTRRHPTAGHRGMHEREEAPPSNL